LAFVFSADRSDNPRQLADQIKIPLSVSCLICLFVLRPYYTIAFKRVQECVLVHMILSTYRLRKTNEGTLQWLSYDNLWINTPGSGWHRSLGKESGGVNNQG